MAALLAEYVLPVRGLPYIAAALVPFVGLCFAVRKPVRRRALVFLVFFGGGASELAVVL